MNQEKVFSKFENANAILNGMDDCCDEFVENFVNLHKQPIDDYYMYEWLLRSLLDVIKIDHSVLYIACGTAGYSKLFKNIRRFVGIDFSKKMIDAARGLNQNPLISFEFKCTTLELFESNESFDVIYMGPYGNNVPYTYIALEKAKKLLKKDGMIFCAFAEPVQGCLGRFKGVIKQFFHNLPIKYGSVWYFEKMLKKSQLEIYVKLRMKTSIGYSLCYIVKSELKDNA